MISPLMWLHTILLMNLVSLHVIHVLHQDIVGSCTETADLASDFRLDEKEGRGRFWRFLNVM